ncbi:MAG: hypothetical protein ACRD40_16415 [Candidatus Acidiferrales bacterium]
MAFQLDFVTFGTDFNRDFGVAFTKEDIAHGNIYNFGTIDFPV